MMKFEQDHSTFNECLLYAGTNHYNPSIINYEGGYLLTYRIQRDNGPIPHNYICKLTSDLIPLESYRIDYGELVPKLSDVRLFWHAEQLMCSFSVKDDYKWRQGIAKINATGHIYDVRYVSLSAVENEKNFQFFSTDDRLLTIAFITPKHIVMDIESGQKFESETPFQWPYGQPRGGTPPIRYGDHWLTCFHSARKVKGLRSLYLAGWYTFEDAPPYRITAMSRRPPMLPSNPWTRMADKLSRSQRGKAVLFPCGLAKYGKEFLLTYGLNDVAPAYRIFTEEDIKASLTAPNLLSWKRKINFGDRLSRPIIQFLVGDKFLGRDVCTRENEGEGRILGLGTILHHAKRGDVVWGSGLGNHLKHMRKYKPPSGITVLAVRGPKTRRLYLESGGDFCPEVYGDPAILMPDYYKPTPIKCNVAILPHIHDSEMASRFHDVPKIDAMCPDIWDTINRIAGCRLLITSSLHGLIVAEAYQVPVVLYLSKMILAKEPLFKYEDYFESTERAMYWLEEGELRDVQQFVKTIPKPIFPDKEKLKSALWTYLSRR